MVSLLVNPAEQQEGRISDGGVESGNVTTTTSNAPQQQEQRQAEYLPNRGTTTGPPRTILSQSPQNNFFRRIKPAEPRNIIIFGETGTGKSSLINMLSDRIVAPVSNGAAGCTFEAQGHPIMIDGEEYNLWDTAGLNEGEAGSVPGDQALQHLHDLVGRLKGGLSLLIYCIRGSRYREILKVNYDLFVRIVCQQEIPVVVVVTGLENEDPMEKWWADNNEDFFRRRMTFAGYACITTTRGKEKEGKFVFEKEYSASMTKVQELIKKNCSSDAFVVDSELWLDQITVTMTKYYMHHNSRSSPEEAMNPSLLATLFSLLKAALTRIYHRAGRQLKDMFDYLLPD